MKKNQGGQAPLRTSKYREVMEALNITYSHMRKRWPSMPHSYVGDQRLTLSLRHARFNIDEVRKWAEWA